DAPAGRGRRGERAHRAGTDDEDMGVGQRADVLGGPVEAGGDERARHLVEAGLGVDALTGAQGLLDERVELGSDVPVRLGPAEGVPQLAEDLGLADGHGVQTGGDVEDVPDGGVAVVEVEVLLEVVVGDRRARGQRIGEVGDGPVEGVDLRVDLGAVARGDDEVLGDVRARLGGRDDGGATRLVEGGALEDGDRRAAVVEAEGQQAHRPTPSTSRTSSVGAPTRCCSWKARICSSVDRSTLRMCTSSGTRIAVAAKLRMELTPASTSRSATSWAEPAGVAM